MESKSETTQPENTAERSGCSTAPLGSARLDGHLTELHNLGNDLEEWCEIRVRKDMIPKGAELVEAYMTAREIIVMGQPPEDDDEETGHNCDAMGCGLSHVLYRMPLPNKQITDK
jgi:hypothetical protein